MITGLHALLFSNDAAADRAFLRDVLGFPFVDDGGGWLIFKLPPAEMGVHPLEHMPPETKPFHQFALMVDDIAATVADLRTKAVTVTDPVAQEYGIAVHVTLPGGGTIEVYEPRHAVATDL